MHKIEPDRGGFRFSVDRLAAPAPDLVRGGGARPAENGPLVGVCPPSQSGLPGGPLFKRRNLKPTEMTNDLSNKAKENGLSPQRS